MTFDSTIRRQFPFAGLREDVAYLDSAATTQIPEAAIVAMDKAVRNGLGNVHRGLHPLADDATAFYERARSTVAAFIGARPEEIVFVKNATEALNLTARSLGETWGEGDVVVLTRLEHHSNILPWQQIASRGVEIRWIGIDANGMLKNEDIDIAFRDGKVKMLSVTGQSNVLGVRPEVAALIADAKRRGVLTCIDAAQLAAHAPINVKELGCDFLALSSHKTYGPTGIGALYAAKDILATMPPFLAGGNMVRDVLDDGFVPADGIQRFEAGTPPILPAIGWGAALEWQSTISWDDRVTHERSIMKLLLSELRSTEGVRVLGPGDSTVFGCVSFTVDGAHPHDIAQLLGDRGVCVRAGHHCAQPLHNALGLSATIRASIGLYTSEHDVQALRPAIDHARSILNR